MKKSLLLLIILVIIIAMTACSAGGEKTDYSDTTTDEQTEEANNTSIAESTNDVDDNSSASGKQSIQDVEFTGEFNSLIEGGVFHVGIEGPGTRNEYDSWYSFDNNGRFKHEYIVHGEVLDDERVDEGRYTVIKSEDDERMVVYIRYNNFHDLSYPAELEPYGPVINLGYVTENGDCIVQGPDIAMRRE